MRAQSGCPVIGQRQVNSPQRSVTSCVWSAVGKVSSCRSAFASGSPSFVNMAGSVRAERLDFADGALLYRACDRGRPIARLPVAGRAPPRERNAHGLLASPRQGGGGGRQGGW